MKNRLLSLAAGMALAGTVTLGLAACDKQGNPKVTESLNTKLTPANIAKLQKGMNRTQVVALFGPPTSSGDVENDVVFKKQTVTYVEGKESLSVTYKNDEVENFKCKVWGTTESTTDDGTTKSTTTTTTKSQ